MESELTKAGMDPKGEYSAIATGQSYGEPETTEIAEKLLDYSKKQLIIFTPESRVLRDSA